MQKFISIFKLIFTSIFLTLVSCEGIFIPDPIDPRIPKYTEEGNNVAGALINQEVWSSTVSYNFMGTGNEPQLILFKNEDSINISFEGVSKYHNYIDFRLSGLNVNDFEDMSRLKNKKILLDGIKNSGASYQYPNYSDNSNYKISENKGQLYFKNVIMKDSLTFILSGTFGFTFKDSNDNFFEVSYGRFDYIFRKNSNFFITEN